MGYESRGELNVRNRIKGFARSTKYEPNPRTYLVYHHTASLGDSENYIATTDKMGIHYLIKRSGSVVRFAWETECPWHAGRTRFGPPRGRNTYGYNTPSMDVTGNADMVGIEIEHSILERHPYDSEYGEMSRYYPVAQLRALDMLAADIYERTPSIVATVSHKAIAYPRPPWADSYRKPDPQYMADHMEEHQIAVVRARLGQEPGEVDVNWTKNPRSMGDDKPPNPTGLPVGWGMRSAISGTTADHGFSFSKGMVIWYVHDEPMNRVSAVVENRVAHTAQAWEWNPATDDWDKQAQQ